MNILMSSITPLFPDKDMGGAQKHLRFIARHLASLGHDVRVVCTYREDTPAPFSWAERAVVLPILRFKQPFPMPYDTGAHRLAQVVDDLGEQLAWADRYYMHDGEMLFPFLYQHIPTAIGLRDNVYPETILGSFLFAGHRLILISQYSRRFVEQTAGRFFPETRDRIRVIPNGIDWDTFQPTPPRRILDWIPGIDPDRHAILLQPHRPEESKGVWEAIATADKLVHTHGIANLRLLIPRWINSDADPGVTDFYQRVTGAIAERGLSDHVVFHDWIPVDLLPEYYSLGAVTLSLGHFVETFGNAVYESIGCGTPTIAARVSTHRELLPPHLIDTVDYGDIDGVARIAADILRSGRRSSDEARAYLRAHYDQRAQLNAFADAILSTRSAIPPRYVPQKRNLHTRYALPVWCYRSPTRGIYHDFKASYLRDPSLDALLDTYPDGFSVADAGIDPARIEAWYREGYLVPT